MNNNTFTEFMYTVIDNVVFSVKTIHEYLWETSVLDLLPSNGVVSDVVVAILEWIMDSFGVYPSLGIVLVGSSFFILLTYKVWRLLLTLIPGFG